MTTIARHMKVATKKSKPLDTNSSNRKTNIKFSPVRIVKIRIDDVQIPDNWRSIDEKAVEALAASMQQIGLQTPISVRATKKGLRLIAGRHRLEAAKKLSRKYIDAIVMRGNKVGRACWRYSENLDRADYTALEYAEAVVKRAKLVSKMAKLDAHPGGHQPNDKGVSKAAKVIGTSRDNIARSKKIAGLSFDAKAAAVETGLDNNQAALLKVAKETTPEDQVRKVRELAKPKRRPDSELSDEDRKQFRRLRTTFETAAKHRRAWKRTSKPARDRFVAYIRKVPVG